MTEDVDVGDGRELAELVLLINPDLEAVEVPVPVRVAVRDPEVVG